MNRKRDYRDSATYWFAVLEIARERGDSDGAAEAEQERLGVRVSYGEPALAGGRQ